MRGVQWGQVVEARVVGGVAVGDAVGGVALAGADAGDVGRGDGRRGRVDERTVMGETTGIKWCDHTFNPWEGCARVSAECTNCYAETRDGRWHGGVHWGKHAERKPMSASYWKQPLKWDREAAAAGVRRRVFCASLADVFEDRRDLDPMRRDLWELIRATPHLDWLLLTKRPEMIPHIGMMSVGRCHCDHPEDSTDPGIGRDGNGDYWHARCQWPDNVWIGTSVGHPDTTHRIDTIRPLWASVRFLSCEPLLADLGPIDLTDIDWVICGGESGPDARPMEASWVRALRDQCADAGVSFFFKQWGGGIARHGAGGHVLDGEVIQQFPHPRYPEVLQPESEPEC